MCKKQGYLHATGWQACLRKSLFQNLANKGHILAEKNNNNAKTSIMCQENDIIIWGVKVVFRQYSNISRRFFFTIYLSIFKEMGDHDNNLSILLPNHFPKSRKSSLNGTLSGNVSPRLAESIHKVGIQVVILVFISFWPQSNASVIIWKKVVM